MRARYEITAYHRGIDDGGTHAHKPEYHAQATRHGSTRRRFGHTCTYPASGCKKFKRRCVWRRGNIHLRPQAAANLIARGVPRCSLEQPTLKRADVFQAALQLTTSASANRHIPVTNAFADLTKVDVSEAPPVFFVPIQRRTTEGKSSCLT